MRITYDSIGVMFLVEVALGREFHIKHVDGSLTRAPDGYDSIVARGLTEPGELCVCLCVVAYMHVHVCVVARVMQS